MKGDEGLPAKTMALLTMGFFIFSVIAFVLIILH